MSVCVSSAGGTLGVDAMSLSQMTLPSSMMLPLAHSSVTGMGGHPALLGQAMSNGQTGIGPMGAIDGSSSMGGSSGLHHNGNGSNHHNGPSLRSGLPSALHDHRSLADGRVSAGATGDLGDHHPNPEMLLALIARNKALEGKFRDFGMIAGHKQLVMGSFTVDSFNSKTTLHLSGAIKINPSNGIYKSELCVRAVLAVPCRGLDSRVVQIARYPSSGLRDLCLLGVLCRKVYAGTNAIFQQHFLLA
uniref:Uncharacterized protein n=1 Tax=Anopheles atroparvus TaxID=41427 RepID=A0A182IL42_ANOAO